MRYPQLPDGATELMALASMSAHWVIKAYHHGARVPKSGMWHVTHSHIYLPGYSHIEPDAGIEVWRTEIGRLLDQRRAYHAHNHQLGSPNVGAVQEGV